MPSCSFHAQSNADVKAPRTQWLLACQYAIADKAAFSEIATRRLYRRWNGKMGALSLKRGRLKK